MDSTWTIIPVSAISGVIVSLLTTFLSNSYTRKNLKTTNYIETIIPERIKWINLLRDDFSLLITSIQVLKNNKNKLKETEFESQRIDYVREITLHDQYLEDNELQDIYSRNQIINDINSALEKCLTPAEIVIKATQIKLRLNLTKQENSNNNLKIIKEINAILDIIISEFSIIDFELSNSNIDIIKLVNLSQTMLTSEWEDIIKKVETK